CPVGLPRRRVGVRCRTGTGGGRRRARRPGPPVPHRGIPRTAAGHLPAAGWTHRVAPGGVRPQRALHRVVLAVRAPLTAAPPGGRERSSAPSAAARARSGEPGRLRGGGAPGPMPLTGCGTEENRNTPRERRRGHRRLGGSEGEDGACAEG